MNTIPKLVQTIEHLTKERDEARKALEDYDLDVDYVTKGYPSKIERIEKERDEAQAKLTKLCLAIDPSSKHGPDIEGIISHFNENIVRRDAKLAELQTELNKRTLIALNATAELKDVIELISKQRSTEQAKCVEMREVLTEALAMATVNRVLWDRIKHALSTDCGKGLVRVKEFDRTLDLLNEMVGCDCVCAACKSKARRESNRLEQLIKEAK